MVFEIDAELVTIQPTRERERVRHKDEFDKRHDELVSKNSL